MHTVFKGLKYSEKGASVPLHSAVFEDVLLGGLGLEDDIEGERLHRVALGLVDLGLDSDVYMHSYGIEYLKTISYWRGEGDELKRNNIEELGSY